MSWTWFFMAAGEETLSQVVLHFLQADSFGLRVDGQHHEELHYHHRHKQDKRDSPGTSSHDGKHAGNESIHEPMSERPEALALGAHQIREHFTEVNPND